MKRIHRRILSQIFSWSLFLTAAAVLTSCSVVFSASLNGSVHDKAQYENNNGGSGIADAEVYLYSEKEDRDADLDNWKEDETLPKEQSVQSYYQITATGEQGNYTFNGYRWEDLFPDFGKSGDRRQVHLLFYHEDYGLQANPHPVYLVSEVSTSLPPIKLESLFEHADLEGHVEDANTGDPVGGVTVRVYISEEGTETADYPEAPSFTYTTNNEEGQYQGEIRFKPTAAARISFSRNGFIADESDPDILQADGKNLDGKTIDDTFSPGDGTGSTYVDLNSNNEFDEGDYFLQTKHLSPDTVYHANTVSMKQTEFNETLDGRVIDSTATPEGQNDVTVWLFVWEDTNNDGTDEDTCTGDASPERSTFTASRLVGDTPEPGYFTFENISWTDEEYSGSSSAKKVTVYLPTEGEEEEGDLSGDGSGPNGTTKEYTLQSGQDNFVVVEQP